MELRKKYNILLWVVSGLLVLNISTVGTIWLHKKPSLKHMHGNYSEKSQKQNRDNILIDALQMDPSQIEIYKESQMRRGKRIKEIKKQVFSSKQSLHDELFKLMPDTNYILKTIDTIGFLNAQIEGINYQHFLEINGILTASQKKQFQAIMNDIICSDTAKHRNNKGKKNLKN